MCFYTSTYTKNIFFLIQIEERERERERNFFFKIFILLSDKQTVGDGEMAFKL